MIGKPAPVPLPSPATIDDIARLNASWCWRDTPPRFQWSLCLADGDPLADYLAELERYRCYVAELRGDELKGCPL